MIRSFVTQLLAFCAVLGLALPSVQPPPLSVKPPVKVTPDAWNATANNLKADVIVSLPGYPDLSAARSMPTKQEKTRYVFDTLTNYADRAQALLRRELTQRGSAFHILWLSNSIAIGSADRYTLDWLARRDDVRQVQLDGMGNGVLGSPAQLSSQARSPAGITWGVSKVNAPEVWALGYQGQGIVLADLDTGVMWDHPALKPHYRGWDSFNATHDYNWYDAVEQQSAPFDSYGHGTHTVGTLVGDDEAGNQIGVAPGAQWIGCRNMDAGGVGSVSRYTECFQFAIAPTRIDGSAPDPAMAADVTTNSWSCSYPESGCDDPMALATITQAVRDAGIMVISAAGNSGSACSTVSDAPGTLDQSFTVGAIDSGESIAGFSSRGPSTLSGKLKPDLVAPGVDIISSFKDGGYTSWQGTSMATPHVAGVVALLWSAAPGLRGEVDDTEAILRRSSKPIGTFQTCGGLPAYDVPNNTYGYGLIDARAAVSDAFRGKLTTFGAGASFAGELVSVSLSLRNYTKFTRMNVVLTATIPMTSTFVDMSPPGMYLSGVVSITLPVLPALSTSSVNLVLKMAEAGWVNLSDTHVTYTDGITGVLVYTHHYWLAVISR